MRPAHLWIGAMLASIGLHAIGLAVLPGDGSWVETIYVGRIYPVLGPLVAFGPSLVPFSVAASLAIGLALWVPGYLLLNVLRWRRRSIGAGEAVTRVALAYSLLAAAGFHSFQMFWGYHYLRPPLEQRLGLDNSGLTADSRAQFARNFVVAANAARVEVADWDGTELDRLVSEAVAKAVFDLENRPAPIRSPLKGDLGTGFLASQGNRGVLVPFTLEAHVDPELPPVVLAFTAAHEKAHQAGFARERDANFVAWLALSEAPDPRLRYSARFGVLNYFLNAETRSLLADGVRADLDAARRYQARRASPALRAASQRVYSNYLRANRMPAGIDDYAQVWQLIQVWAETRSG